jgi:hypothetical protein
MILLVPAVALAATTVMVFLSASIGRDSADRLRARQAEQPLVHELPYWAFLDTGDLGVAVHVDLTYSAFAELGGLDTDCMDSEALNQISHSLHGVLQGVPPDTILQFLYWTDGDVRKTVEDYRAHAVGAHPLGRMLIEEKSEALLRTRGLRRSRLVLGVSLAPATGAGAQASRWLGRIGFGPRSPERVTDAQHQESLKRLTVALDQVRRGLGAAGVRSRVLDAGETRRLVYQFLNPEHSRVVPDPAGWSEDQTAREQLLCAGILEQRESVICDGQLTRVLTLKSLPTWTEPALLEALLVSLPFHCRVQVAVETFDSVRALDDLKRRRDQAHLLATLRERRNQEAEAQEQDVAELIDKNLRSSLRMVRIALSVVLSVDSRRPDAQVILDGQTQEVKRLVGALHGAQLMVDEHAQLDELLATLPGNARRTRRWRRCTSENASHLLLAWQAWSGAARPTLLVQNGRGHLVGIDPFDEELDNPNAFMAGASGSGKSATTNYLLLNLLASGARALVVDVGGSYRRLMELFGGQYFAITLDRQVDEALNPFFAAADIVGEGGRLEERRLAFILAVVERMVCDARRPELGNAERAVLGAAVERTYRVTRGRTPILSDLLGVLRASDEGDPEDIAVAHTLARELRVWVEGPAARLVNRPSTLSLTTELAAFDLKGLETHPQLQSVVMLILSGIIWNLVMREPTARKIVVFDEVWRLLEAPSSARLIAELYRTSRKYRASILTISQSVEDFTASPIATALTNNSATVYLLKHRRGHELVAEQFHLNPREEHVFRSLEMRRGEFTEALILHGEHHFLARIVLSPLEYWIATSHPADHQLEKELWSEQPHLSRMDVLRILAARFPRGASAERDGAADAA